MMNVFEDEVGAARYDRARPYFHPAVMERSRDVLGGGRLRLVLDVACGTGQSADAVAGVSDSVIGVDASAAMLRHARRLSSVTYVRALGEHLPFRASTFDLVSVGLAVHWLEPTAFLREAHRVLRPERWLLIYDSGFCERIRGNPAFGEWVLRYRQRFPAPWRNRHPPSPESVAQAGFREILSDELVHVERLDLARLIAYLATQSNVLHAVREGRDSHGSAVEWLRATLMPLLEGRTWACEYDGWFRVYRRAG